MSNKFAFGQRSIYNQKRNGKKTFYFGRVEGNQDLFETGSIKVRIKGIDDHYATIDDLPPAFPLLQKFFNITPKVGETVIVFFPDSENAYSDRVYMGPIISQPQLLDYDKHFYTSKSAFDSGFVEPMAAPSTLPENLGVHPNKLDVSLQGRGNSDIILKKNEAIIRAGIYTPPNEVTDIKKFNKKDPAYIQLKYDAIIDRKDGNDVKGTVTNIVASKINLLTHDGGAPRFVLNDQVDNITQEELDKILTDAHPLAFGDSLIEYLKLLRNAFINHVHPYHGKKAQDLAGVDDIDKYLEFDIDSILSKNIRIN